MLIICIISLNILLQSSTSSGAYHPTYIIEFNRTFGKFPTITEDIYFQSSIKNFFDNALVQDGNISPILKSKYLLAHEDGKMKLSINKTDYLHSGVYKMSGSKLYLNIYNLKIYSEIVSTIDINLNYSSPNSITPYIKTKNEKNTFKSLDMNCQKEESTTKCGSLNEETLPCWENLPAPHRCHYSLTLVDCVIYEVHLGVDEAGDDDVVWRNSCYKLTTIDDNPHTEKQFISPTITTTPSIDSDQKNVAGQGPPENSNKLIVPIVVVVVIIIIIAIVILAIVCYRKRCRRKKVEDNKKDENDNLFKN